VKITIDRQKDWRSIYVPQSQAKSIYLLTIMIFVGRALSLDNAGAGIKLSHVVCFLQTEASECRYGCYFLIFGSNMLLFENLPAFTIFGVVGFLRR
jgi:hypothetical protein